MDAECTSGCDESGWTFYLDHHSLLSPYPSHNAGNEIFMTDDKRSKLEEEEEDLSMVSDASSGPSHFHVDDDDNNGCLYNATLPKSNGKRQKKKEYAHRNVQEQHLSVLDDTASSPIVNVSKNNLILINSQASMENMSDFSQAHSSTHFQRKSTFQEHFGFFQSPVSGTQLQQNQWFERMKQNPSEPMLLLLLLVRMRVVKTKGIGSKM